MAFSFQTKSTKMTLPTIQQVNKAQINYNLDEIIPEVANNIKGAVDNFFETSFETNPLDIIATQAETAGKTLETLAQDTGTTLVNGVGNALVAIGEFLTGLAGSSLSGEVPITSDNTGASAINNLGNALTDAGNSLTGAEEVEDASTLFEPMQTEEGKSLISKIEKREKKIQKRKAKMNEYMNVAVSIADDPTHGYSMDNRDGPDYDCASFVYYTLLGTGFSKKDLGKRAFDTSKEGKALKKAGFEELDYDKSKLKKGDIIVDPRLGSKGHTEIIYSVKNGVIKTVAAHSNYDGVSGDSGNNEISIDEFYEGHHQYTHIYRLKTPDKVDVSDYVKENKLSDKEYEQAMNDLASSNKETVAKAKEALSKHEEAKKIEKLAQNQS